MEELKPSLANSAPLTPLTFLERASLVYGASPSIVYNNTTYTWSETHRRCLQAASAISGLGIGRGHVVSVVAPNVPAMYESHFAVPMTGAVLNNINTRLNAKTISVLLHHSQAKLVLVYCQLRSLVLEAISLLPSNHPRPVLVLISDEDDVENSPLSPEFYSTYEDLIRKGDPNYDWVRPISDSDPIVLNYTSGTTSAPKGVVHCHKGFFVMSLDTLAGWSVPNQPVYLWTLAMFHTNGWCFPWAIAAVGGTNVCLRHFDGATIFDLIHRNHVTLMCAAPVVLNMMLNHPNAPRLKWPVHIITGGSPPPTAVLQRAEALGFVVDHGYGLTETGGCVITCAWKPEWNKLPLNERARLKARQGIRSIGMTAYDVVHVNSRKAVKRDGQTMGELVIRGSCIMLGYYKDPQATAKCLDKDGWFRTGDLCVMHPDGYVEIKDRSKDIIISGGENISSVEVESVLYGFPGVNEVAVVAQPHDHWGETPCAFVSLKEGLKVKPTEKEIIEYCRSKLPHYMVPKKVVLKDELPKTSTGKIKKFLLRDMARAMVSNSSSQQVSRL